MDIFELMELVAVKFEVERTYDLFELLESISKKGIEFNFEAVKCKME